MADGAGSRGDSGERFSPSRFCPSRFCPSRFCPSRFFPNRFCSSRSSPSRSSPHPSSRPGPSPSHRLGRSRCVPLSRRGDAPVTRTRRAPMADPAATGRHGRDRIEGLGAARSFRSNRGQAALRPSAAAPRKSRFSRKSTAGSPVPSHGPTQALCHGGPGARPDSLRRPAT